jgi:hypothetical protein
MARRAMKLGGAIDYYLSFRHRAEPFDDAVKLGFQYFEVVAEIVSSAIAVIARMLRPIASNRFDFGATKVPTRHQFVITQPRNHTV